MPAGREWLHGAGVYRIDGKARLMIPASYRGPFSIGKNTAVVSRHNLGCLAIWPHDVFQARLAAAYAVQDDGPEEFERAQRLIWNSDPADIDPQWRVTLPAESRAYARLETESPVRVVGAFEHIELWEPGYWDERNNRHLDKMMTSNEPLFPSRKALATGGLPSGGAA